MVSGYSRVCDIMEVDITEFRVYLFIQGILRGWDKLVCV
jgi:hypothetical protein